VQECLDTSLRQRADEHISFPIEHELGVPYNTFAVNLLHRFFTAFALPACFFSEAI
jgi:hypothetical protein